MSSSPVSATFTVRRAGKPVLLQVDGTVSVRYGEDVHGDTVRYQPRIERVLTILVDEDFRVGPEWDDSLSPDEEERAEDALCEMAHELSVAP